MSKRPYSSIFMPGSAYFQASLSVIIALSPSLFFGSGVKVGVKNPLCYGNRNKARSIPAKVLGTVAIVFLTAC